MALIHYDVVEPSTSEAVEQALLEGLATRSLVSLRLVTSGVDSEAWRETLDVEVFVKRLTVYGAKALTAATSTVDHVLVSVETRDDGAQPAGAVVIGQPVRGAPI